MATSTAGCSCSLVIISGLPQGLRMSSCAGIVAAIAYSWQKLYGRKGFGLRKEGVPYSALVEITTVKDS